MVSLVLFTGNEVKPRLKFGVGALLFIQKHTEE